MGLEQPILVFSHLRWSWVYQRPQHLLARVARTRPVFFVEEPEFDPHARQPHWRQEVPQPGVRVCRPRTNLAEPGFTSGQIDLLRPLLRQLLKDNNCTSCVAWAYTPMAVPLLRELEADAVVYDCMDELSAFRGAPPELVDRERQLFDIADVVFTGGPSLYEAKRAQHPYVHCFASSVDAAHFGRARGQAEEPADQARLPRPRLGFFGVIDERFDLPLLDALACARPHWQISLVGPVTKIDPALLPRHPNLHYFGQRAYESLPGFLQGWDVALLLFARNEATRFISPTKTLEYMAAEKPIVSTPIRDVAEPYGRIVRVADTPADFISACDQALAEPPAERARRVAAMRQVLARTSWDRTVADMLRLIDEAVVRHRAARSADRWTQSPRPPATPTRGAPHARLVIIGAGPTGLSAAYHAPDSLLLEQNDTVGGWCRSVEVNGFTFDYAGHIMFSNDPYVHELYQRLLGDNVHWQDREAWIYSKNVYTRYPFQGALYGLPPEVIKECIVGAIEARFGALNAAAQNPAPPGPAAGNGEPQPRSAALRASARAPRRPQRACATPLDDCCADGVLESTAPLVRPADRRTARRGNGDPGGGNGSTPDTLDFEEFIYRVWGAGIARHFAIPYNRKLWAVPLKEMETSWLGGRVPLPDLEEMIDGALRPVPKPMGPNARFGYPRRGGFQALMNGFLPHVQRRLRLNAAVTAISPRRHTVTVNGDEELRYDALVSTMPLPVLVRQLGREAPPHVRRAAAALRFVSVRCVHIGVGREQLTEKHWIYYPEDTVFHRIFVQGNASPHCNPPGGFGLTCEITYAPTKPLPCDGPALTRRCIDDCIRVGLIAPADPIRATLQCDLPHAYVVYDHYRAANVKTIREWLLRHDIHLAGRYSEWEYYNSDHAFLAGRDAVAAAARSTSRPQSLPAPA